MLLLVVFLGNVWTRFNFITKLLFPLYLRGEHNEQQQEHQYPWSCHPLLLQEAQATLLIKQMFYIIK